MRAQAGRLLTGPASSKLEMSGFGLGLGFGARGRTGFLPTEAAHVDRGLLDHRLCHEIGALLPTASAIASDARESTSNTLPWLRTRRSQKSRCFSRHRPGRFRSSRRAGARSCRASRASAGAGRDAAVAAPGSTGLPRHRRRSAAPRCRLRRSAARRCPAAWEPPPHNHPHVPPRRRRRALPGAPRLRLSKSQALHRTGGRHRRRGRSSSHGTPPTRSPREKAPAGTTAPRLEATVCASNKPSAWLRRTPLVVDLQAHMARSRRRSGSLRCSCSVVRPVANSLHHPRGLRLRRRVPGQPLRASGIRAGRARQPRAPCSHLAPSPWWSARGPVQVEIRCRTR